MELVGFFLRRLFGLFGEALRTNGGFSRLGSLSGVSVFFQNFLSKNQHAVEMQIRQVDAQWVAVVAKKDPKLIAQFYTENGALLAPNTPIAEGREAIADQD